jgi:hypothetical protein
MNPSETQSENCDVADQIAALRRQSFVLLLALIVVSGTLAAYLFYQTHIIKSQLDAVKPQALQVIQTVNQNRPAMENFIGQLVAYGQTHPDFQKEVLNKYGLVPPPAAPKTAAPVKK